jgi:phthiocerol/phenolphthiocerol synthesis type-I polyketide synthase D
VVAGDPAEIEQLIAGWERRGLLARRVAADVASHSPQVDCLLDELAGLLHDLEPAMPNVPFYSTVGREEPALFGAAHWVNNLREPVQLAGAVSAAAADGFRTFLEISPHPVLTYAVAETAGDEAVVLPSLTRGQNDEEALRTQLGRLYCAGVPVDWSRLYGAGRLVDVPVRAWERTRHWIEVPFPHPHRAGAQDPSHPLLGVSLDVPGEEERRVWRTDLGTGRVPWLADHCLHDGAVLPGAGFCEMALAAASEFFAVPPTEVEVESIAFECFLALTEQTIVSTTVTSTAPGRARLEVFTQAGGHWLRHATAELGKVPPGRPERADIPALTSEHVRAVEVPAFYARLREFGYHYGPAFTGLMALRTCPSADTVLARVRVPAHARNTPGLLLHPVLLDVCLQALGAAHAANSGVDGTATPHSVGRLRIFGDTARTRLCHGIVTAHDTGSLTGIVRLLADDGTCLAEIHDVHFRSVEASVRRLDPLFHQIEWLPAPAEGRSGISDWLVLGDDQPLKEALEARLQAEGGVIGGPARSGIVVLATGSGDDGVQDALRLLQEAIGARRPARLWFVTRGACGRGDDLVPGAALRGLARVLMFEHEELSPVLVDLDPGGADPATTAGELAVELAAGRGADEVVLRGGVRHVARMVNAPPAAGPRPGPVVRADGAYVITGGLGGIGLELARWLAGLGAAHLVLNGRSAPSPLAESVLTELRGEGVRIEVVLGDLAEPGVAERLVAGAGVRGVIHAAAMVDDAVLTELTPEQVERTWRPKVTGAVRLHEATLHNDLDWFVMFSSGSAMFGSLGLGAYAAANAWLDGFAVWRRSLGLPALSIGWGPWGEAGLAVGLGDRGYATLPTRDALASLRLLLEAGTGAPASIGVFPPDPEHWFEPAPALAGSSFFAALPRAAATECEGRIRAELQQLDQVSRPPAMRNYLAARIQRVLDLDAPIDPAASLVALGFDSLSAMRLRRTLQEDLAVRVPATVVWTHPTLTVLTDHLLERTLEGP